MKKIDIVIAYFNEDLSWIDELDTTYINKIYIYNKSGDDRYIPLPNIGLDTHTHLYHIVNNYDNLADAIIFLQGNPFGHECEPRSVLDINNWLKTLQINDHTLNYHLSPFDGGLYNGKIDFWNGYRLVQTGYEIGEWLYKYLNHPKTITSGPIYWSSQFGVSKELILKNSQHLYELLLSQHTSKHVEIAHFMERAWGVIFDIRANYLSVRSNFGYFLNYHNLTNCGVEIGTFKGDFSKVILSTWGGTLYMIDPWRALGDEYIDDSNHKFHRNAYEETMVSINGYEDRAFMLRGLSKQMVHLFGDNSLDFVYIDGNHEYSFVKEDIELWYPKVKDGGIISGHDYCLFNGKKYGWYEDKTFHEDGINKHIWSSDGEKYYGVFGVNPAVDEFCKENNYELNHTNEWDATWYFFK
jgi:hypothetical protein